MIEEMRRSELDFYKKEQSELDRLVGLLVTSKQETTVDELISHMPHLLGEVYDMVVEGNIVYAVFDTVQGNAVTLVGTVDKLATFRREQVFIVDGLVHGHYEGE